PFDLFKRQPARGLPVMRVALAARAVGPPVFVHRQCVGGLGTLVVRARAEEVDAIIHQWVDAAALRTTSPRRGMRPCPSPELTCDETVTYSPSRWMRCSRRWRIQRGGASSTGSFVRTDRR